MSPHRRTPMEESLQPRRLRVTPKSGGGGYEVVYEPCGHQSWWAVPPRVGELVCSQCVEAALQAKQAKGAGGGQ